MLWGGRARFAEAYRRGGPEPPSLTGAGEARPPQERPLTTANGPLGRETGLIPKLIMGWSKGCSWG